MQIIAKCPQCANPLSLVSDAQDRRITCPKCQCLFRIPKIDQIPKAKKIIEQAKTSVHVDMNGNMFG